MNWLTSQQACRLLQYKNKQLWRLAFVLDHRETPAGVEWAEESLNLFLQMQNSKQCVRCGGYALEIIRHLRWCYDLPTPLELAAEYRAELLGVSDLAAKYQLSGRLMRMRLELGGISESELKVQQREVIAKKLQTSQQVLRCHCGLRIFHTPQEMPDTLSSTGFPLFEWFTHANIQGYCPACAIKLQQVNPAELTALLNRPLH